MIPSNSGFLQRDFVIENQTSRTYKMDFEKFHIRGKTDKLIAMEQAVFKIIYTERYQHSIYSNNYGIQLIDLFGEPIGFVIPEIKRRIIEALTWDDRINSVDSFSFEIIKRNTVHVSFTVHTIYGDFIAERAVNF